MTTDNSNRFRISTKFTLLKIGLVIGLCAMIINSAIEISNKTLTQNSIIGLILGTIALTGVYYFISTRKRIDYDDIKQVLYVVDIKRQTEIGVPVENIRKILYSSLGGRGIGSYIIIYRNSANKEQSVRLFPIPLDKTIDIIKTDTKLKNPNLVIRNWSVG